MKLEPEFILGAILIPIIITVFTAISDLQSADAVQQVDIKHLIEVTEETRSDVKELMKESRNGKR